MDLKSIFYPESRFGGFSDIDGTMIFFMRVNALVKPTDVILDIGCGRGAYADDPVPLKRQWRVFKGRCRQVVGIDMDPAAAANPFMDEFRRFNGDYFPVEDASVDVGICNAVLEHVENPDLFFFECARVAGEGEIWREYFKSRYGLDLEQGRVLLVTGHRRENFGRGFEDICLALRDLVEHCPGVQAVYPVHLNPHVQQAVFSLVAQIKAEVTQRGEAATVQVAGGGSLTLLPPLEYAPFVYLMSRSYLVLTDSGGIQEEAPALGKPVLVMREVTERPEGVWAQTVRLVGTDRQRIFQEVKELLDNPEAYRLRAQARNPYGDGQAAQRIVETLSRELGRK